jgi:hypothetical protein
MGRGVLMGLVSGFPSVNREMYNSGESLFTQEDEYMLWGAIY